MPALHAGSGPLRGPAPRAGGLSRPVLALVLVAALLGIPARAAAQPVDTDPDRAALLLLQGRLVDAGTGAPVEGGTVEVSGPRRLTVLSADDGRWRVPDLPAGRYTVRVEHLAYAPAERVVQLPGTGEPLRISLTARPVLLDALVVTAGRRLQRLADVPVATELVTQQEILETGATDLAAVLTERAGIQLEGGHPVGAGVMIQGLGAERVMILMDGQPMIGRISGKIDVSRIPTAMIERVEVVKGSQSTLYGSEAMGGVVNIITRDLDGAAWNTSATVLGGSQGRMDVTGSILGGAGPVTASFDGGRRMIQLAPGWEGDTGALAERWDGMGKVAWRTPVDGLRMEASGMLLDERQRWRSGQLYSFADNLQWTGRVGAQFDRGAHRLTPNLYVTSFDHLSRRSTSEDPVAGTGQEETQRLLEAEVLYGLDMGRHTLDMGLEARREDIRSERVQGGERDFQILESFVQTTLNLGPVALVPGVRGTWSNPWGNYWTPRVAAMVRPVSSLALRVSAGEGFRAPAFKELFMSFLNVGPGFGYTVQGNPDLRPETSRNLTGSVEWTGARAYLRVEGFHNRFDDFIETRTVGDSANVAIITYGNVDDGFTRGVEFDAGLALGGWRFEAGLGLLEARDGGTGDVLLGRPERSFRGMVSHARPSGLRFGLTGLHTGRTPMSREADGVLWREGFTRFDLRVAQRLPAGLEFVAGVDNVLDRQVADWPGFVGRQIYTSLTWQADGRRGGIR